MPIETASGQAQCPECFADVTLNKVMQNEITQCPGCGAELEITALNQVYLEEGKLHVELLGRGFAWEDAGTHDSLIQAGELIRTFEQRQGLRIGCLEEIAYQQGWIGREELIKVADLQAKSEYGKYLRELAERPPGEPAE